MYFLAPATGGSFPSFDELAVKEKRTGKNADQPLNQLCRSVWEFGQSHVEWHALNFCHLDTSWYMASIGAHGFLLLMLGEWF